MSVKRYKLFRDHQQECFCEIDEHPAGSYVDFDDYDAVLKLLERADETIRCRVDHDWSCPRLRDDYDCTCGLSDLRDELEQVLR
jgi:hypothetical protein